MNPRSPLHMSALLLTLFAACWALISFVGALIFLIPILAIAGFVYLLVHGRRMVAEDRLSTMIGGWIGAGVYGIWILLTLAGTPVGIRGTEGYHPPTLFADLAAGLAPLLAVLGAFAILIGYWAVWQRREQVLGIIGTVLVSLVLVVSATGLTLEDWQGTLMTVLFVVGYIILAAATALPLAGSPTSHPTWHQETA